MTPQAQLEQLLKTYHPGERRLGLLRQLHPAVQCQLDILLLMREMEIKLAKKKLAKMTKRKIN